MAPGPDSVLVPRVAQCIGLGHGLTVLAPRPVSC